MFARPIPTTRLALSRSFANQLPRPPSKPLPPPETFSSTSRPRQYYSRPHPRDLPPYRVSHCSWVAPCIVLKQNPLLFLAGFKSNLAARMARPPRSLRRWRRRVGRILVLRR